jgi:hypothetical protein
VALLAHVSAGNGSGSSVTTGPVNSNGASLIVVTAGWFNAGSGACSITDSYGNLYSGLTRQTSGFENIQLFFIASPAAGAGHTFTINAPAGSSSVTIEVQVWSGFNTYLSQNGASSGGGFRSTFQPGAVVPSVSGVLIITGLSASGAFSITSIDSGFAITDTTSPSPAGSVAGMAYLVQPSAGSVDPTWTFPFAVPVAVIAVFAPTGVSVPASAAASFALSGGVSIPNVDVGGGMAASFSMDGGVSLGSEFDVPGSGAASFAMSGAVVLSSGISVPGSAAANFQMGGAVFIGSGIPVAGSATATFGMGGSVTVPIGSSCPLGCATIGQPYSSNIPAQGGVPPYYYSLQPGPNVSQNINAVFLGDSMVRGDYPPATPPVTPWPTQLGDLLGFTPVNLGIDGETTAGVLANEVPNAVAIPGCSNRGFLLCGVNDAGTGVPLATIQANYQAIIAQMQAKGFYMTALTISPSNYSAYPDYPDYILVTEAINTWLLGSGSGADAVCNSGGDPRLANPGNSYYFYSDELHLYDPGLAVVAQDAGATMAPPLPPGLVLNQNTGAITGTPTAIGTFPFVLEVTDSNGNVTTRYCSITVTEPSGVLGISISTLASGLAKRLGLKLALQDFYTLPELDLYVRQSIREFQVLTNYWRGSVQLNTSPGSPFYDLHALGIIPFTVYDTDILNQVGYHLLEFSGTQVLPINTKQFTMGALSNAFDQRREEILGETRLVVVQNLPSSVLGRLQLDPTVLQVHRVEWLNTSPLPTWNQITQSWSSVSQTWNQLGPTHSWSLVSRTDEIGGYGWLYGWSQQTATVPYGYSSADTPPFQLQFIPEPTVAGSVSLLITQSIPYDYGCAHVPQLIQIPDDAAYALPWGILASMLSQDAQSRDNGRAGYAQKRFRDALEVLKTWPCLMNAYLNGLQILPSTLFELDHWMAGWRNLTSAQPTAIAIGGRNLLACAPVPNTNYTIPLDCVVNSPGSVSDRYETFDMAGDMVTAILDNAYHTACFKLQGKEFADTMELRREFLLVAKAYADRERAQSINWRDLLGTTGHENADKPYESEEVEA